MNPLKEIFESGQTILWIETQNTVAFLRPVPDILVWTPCPTARLAQPLCFRQVRFTAPEGFLGAFAIFDVGRDPIPFDDEALRGSEAYLAEAQRLSQTGSWAWSPDQDIRYWSEECYRVLSFDPQDGLPRFEDFFQRIHPDDQPGFRELIETAIREKAEWEADYRIVHQDGPVRDIHVLAHPVLSTSGHLVEFVGTVIDVTERKRAEEERRRSEMELRQMLDLMPQHLAVLAPDGTPLYANRVALEYLGVDMDRWRTETSRFGLLHPRDREKLLSQRQSEFLKARHMSSKLGC